MGTAPIKFRDWATGPETVIVDPGVGDDSDLIALVPIAEPLSAGYPPIAPDFITKMGGAGFKVASCPVRSGQRRTYAQQTAPRTVKWMLRWENLTQEERDELEAFLATELQWTRVGMDVDVDGEGATESTLVLRPVAVPVQHLQGPRGPGGQIDGTWKCVWTVEVECEELF